MRDKLLGMLGRLRGNPIDRILGLHRRALVLPKILDWRFPYFALEPHPVSVHIACGARGMLPAAWTAASFFHATRQNWHLVVHAGKSLTEEGADWFAEAFPRCRVIPHAESEERMETALRDRPRCRALRRNEPLLGPLFDAPHFAQGRKVLLIRPPTFFFRAPEDLLACASDPADGCWFSKGRVPLPEPLLDLLEERLGLRPWPRIEGSLALLSLAAFSHDLCEAALHIPQVAEAEPAELFAVLAGVSAARFGRGGVLGPEYAPCPEAALPGGAASCHYPGGAEGAAFDRGLEEVADSLWPEPEAS